eukprot:3062616-Prymnesium_polylepis.1
MVPRRMWCEKQVVTWGGGRVPCQSYLQRGPPDRLLLLGLRWESLCLPMHPGRPPLHNPALADHLELRGRFTYITAVVRDE